MGKDKDGQALVPINTNDERYVAQANEFVEGRQNLKLNSAKIMRAVIMQINADDDENFHGLRNVLMIRKLD